MSGVSYKIVPLLMIGRIRHAPLPHPAIKASVQYLCNISKYDYDHDKDDFLHEDKNQSFLQVYSIIFTGNR